MGYHDPNPPVVNIKRKSNTYVGTKHPVFLSGREETPYPRLAKQEASEGVEQTTLERSRKSYHAMHYTTNPCNGQGRCRNKKNKQRSFI